MRTFDLLYASLGNTFFIIASRKCQLTVFKFLRVSIATLIISKPQITP